MWEYVWLDGSFTIDRDHQYPACTEPQWRSQDWTLLCRQLWQSTQTVFEFLGCWWHGCETCKIERSPELQKRLEWTQEQRDYRIKMGYNVVEMWEHNWTKLCKDDPRLHEFVRQCTPSFYYKHRYHAVTEQQFLNAVCDKELFGFLEVDIIIPDELVDFFSEMPPLFCNTNVSFEDIGQTMQTFIEENNLSKKSRRLIVGGLRAEKTLRPSPYLKWPRDHGLTVTKLYQVVEFTPVKCFQKFMTQISGARRMGDQAKKTSNSSQSIIADTWKLIRNSAYGCLIMDKEKHENACYVPSLGKAQMKWMTQSFADVLRSLKTSMKSRWQKIPLWFLGSLLWQIELWILWNGYWQCIYGNHWGNIGGHCPSSKMTALCWISCCTLQWSDIQGRGWVSTQRLLWETPYIWQMHSWFVQTAIWRWLYGVALLQNIHAAKIWWRHQVQINGSEQKCSRELLHCQQACPDTGENASVINKGIKMQNNKIVTYQERRGLSYLYCKRIVQSDGIHTKPFDITLCLWKWRPLEVMDCHHPWSLTTV